MTSPHQKIQILELTEPPALAKLNVYDRHNNSHDYNSLYLNINFIRIADSHDI